MDRIEIAFENLIKFIKNDKWTYSRLTSESNFISLRHESKDIVFLFEKDSKAYTLRDVIINKYTLLIEFTNEQMKELFSEIKPLLKDILDKEVKENTENQLQTLLN